MAPCLPCTLLLFDFVPKTIALPKHSNGRFRRTLQPNRHPTAETQARVKRLCEIPASCIVPHGFQGSATTYSQKWCSM